MLYPLILSALLLQPQPQAASVDKEQAIAGTREGMREASLLKAKWAPRLAALEAREAAIESDRKTLERESRKRRGIWPFRHAMSAKEKARKTGEIDRRAQAVIREREDDRNLFEQDRMRIVNRITVRLEPLVENYAREHGYSVAPAGGIDITAEIVQLYDETYPDDKR